MTVSTREEFAKRMMLLSRPAEKFRPTATYEPDGDCIEFLVSPEPFYAERVDDLLTVYYSQESGEVVGSNLKGVSKFCREVVAKLPGFMIEVRDGRVKLVHFFRAKLWSSKLTPEDTPALVYRKLIQVATVTEAEVEAQECFA